MKSGPESQENFLKHNQKDFAQIEQSLFRFWIGDFGFRIGCRNKSAISIPKSEIELHTHAHAAHAAAAHAAFAFFVRHIGNHRFGREHQAGD